MDILTPDKIDELLDNRLHTTLKLYNELDMNDTEIYNVVHFRFYFDFSTAIECTIYNILYQKYGNDDFIFKKSKIDSQAVSKYLPNEEMKLLIDGFGEDITVEEIKNRFSYLSDIFKPSFYQSLGLERELYDIEAFNSLYTKSRAERNKLAHGLTLINVDFSKKMLFKFLASYYVIIQYYRSIYCSN